MVNDEALISMAKKGEISKFMVALRKAKEEGYMQGLKSRHGASKPSGGTGISSPSKASGSGISKGTFKSSLGAAVVLDEDEEGSDVEKEDRVFESDEDEARRENHEETLPPHPKMKVSGQSSTSGIKRREAEITRNDSKGELESQRKEIELLKRRVETAEGNVVALVGRVQDFRTSLRSEIRTMPPEVDSEGLSRLSAAIETTIDDAGLYLRNVSGGLKQSRTNWEIHRGIQTESGLKQEPRTDRPVGRKGNAKRKVEELGEDEEEELHIMHFLQKKFRGLDWDEKKEKQVNKIVSRPRAAAAPILPKIPDDACVRSRAVSHWQGTGELFERPCSTCVLAGRKCEKGKNGGACVGCKAKRHKCEYSQLRRRAKKNKETGESEDDQEFVP